MKEFGLAFVAIFVALDIIGTVPMYFGMTRGLDTDERKRIVHTSMGVALAVALVFLFLGQAIFKFLGIGVPDFKIAGGLVLLLVSLADLLGGPEVIHQTSQLSDAPAKRGPTGVVPLAVPLITGPGILTTIILHVESVGYLITLAAVLANYALGWILLSRSEAITRYLGKDGTVVLSKIAALLLAAIAVAMIRGGVVDVIRAL